MGRERGIVFSIFGITVLISILIISIPEAQAIPFTPPFELEDENSKVTIDVTSPVPLIPTTLDPIGVETWSVDGLDYIFEQWFFVRVCSGGPEVPLDSFDLLGTDLKDLDSDGDFETLTIFLKGEGLFVDISYTLIGETFGSDESQISESIKIESASPGPVCDDIHFFQYSDFDMPLSFTGDFTIIAPFIAPITAVQFNGASGGTTAISETVAFPVPSHFETTEFPITKAKLLDAFPTTLIDNLLVAVIGDGTWAFQWDYDISATPIFKIEKCKRVGPAFGISPIFQTGNPDCKLDIPDSIPGDGAGGHEPPTIGKNLRGNYQIVTDGICIDAQCWTVTEDFHGDFELVEMLTSPHTISNTIYCSKGVDTCNHITLSASPYQGFFNAEIWKVSLDKNLLGELTVTKDDPDNYLGDTTCTAQIIEEKYWGTSCTIDFLKPMPGVMLGVQLWDDYGGVRNFFFNDGIEVIDTYGYPSVDTEFESSLDVPRLCLSDDPDKRTSCAFAKKMQLEIERAEKLLT